MGDVEPDQGDLAALEDFARLAIVLTSAQGACLETDEGNVSVGEEIGEAWEVPLKGIGRIVLFGGTESPALAPLARCIVARREREDAHTASLALAERANDIARTSARRFQALFEGLPIACYACDAEGALREWNRAAEEMWGPAIASGSGMPVAPIVDPDHPEAERDVLRRALAGKMVRTEEREVRIGSGELRWHLVSALPLRDADERVIGVIGSRLDITRRRAAQRELAEREARFRTVLEALHEGITVLDEQGRLVFSNRYAETMLHLNTGDGLDFGAIFPPITAVEPSGRTLALGEWPIFAALREGRSTRDARLRLVYSDGGTPINVSVNAEPLRDSESGALLGAVASFRKLEAP